MSFSRFELGFTRNRKVAGLSDASFRLWVSAIDYAREQKTDGWISPNDLDIVPRCPSGPRREALVAEIVQAGLWHPSDGGWEIHDFLDWQDSAVQVNEKAKRARERMREIRSPRSREHHANTPDDCSREVLDGPSDPPLRSGSPSQADPDQPERSGSPGARGASSKPRRRSALTPMPEPFELSAEHLKYAAKKSWPTWWVRNRHEQFCDLARSKEWRYANWDLAFYTYLRGEIGYRRGPEDLAHLAPKPGTASTGQTPADRERARVAAERERQWAQDAAELAQTGTESIPSVKAILEGIGGR